MSAGVVSVSSVPRAAYVHVPFCARRCGYCNFTLIADRADLVPRYLEVLAIELGWLGESRPVDTLFYGGGTPSQLSATQLARLLELTMQWFPVTGGGEVSLEANPADVDAELIDVLREHGVTRLSIGAQSFRDDKLRMLERDHRGNDVRRAFELARTKLSSVSLDLIFGTPGETLDEWTADVKAALVLEPDHLSLYGLTYERGTTFWNRLMHGELARLDEDAERAMFERAIDLLTAAPFEHYEVSNFARAGHRCRHNEVYWAAEEFYGAGPGAARYIAGRREVNHRSTTTYLRRVLSGESPVAESECLPPEERAREALVLGLRRMAGIERDDFRRRTGFNVDELAGEAIRRFVELGLIEDDGRHIRLTREGLLISDSLWPKLLRP